MIKVALIQKVLKIIQSKTVKNNKHNKIKVLKAKTKIVKIIFPKLVQVLNLAEEVVQIKEK